MICRVCVIGLVFAVLLVLPMRAVGDPQKVSDHVEEIRQIEPERMQSILRHQEAFIEDLRRCRELSDDPVIRGECARAMRLAMVARLRRGAAGLSITDVGLTLDELISLGNACIGHGLLCELLGEESVHCVIWRACVGGDAERLGEEAGVERARIAALDTSFELGECMYWMTPSSPRIRVRVEIGSGFPKGDLRFAINAAEGFGEEEGLFSGMRLVGMLHGVTPDVYEIDLRIPLEAVEGKTTELFVVLTDSSGELVMANSASLFVGWHKGDFNRDGKSDMQDVIEAARALAEGRISRGEFDQIRSAVLSGGEGLVR